MPSTSEAIVALLAALAALVIVALLGWVCKGFLAGLQARFFKGHNVTGIWTAKYERQGQSRQENATLQQLLHWVRGEVRNPHLGQTYKIHGQLLANVFVATYEVKKKEHEIDCGAFTLLIAANGRQMQGHYSWIDSDTNAPESGSYVWERT